MWRGVTVPTPERVEAGRRKVVGRGRALANGPAVIETREEDRFSEFARG